MSDEQVNEEQAIQVVSKEESGSESEASESDAEEYEMGVQNRIAQLLAHTQAYTDAKEALRTLLMAQNHYPCDLHENAVRATTELYAAGCVRITHDLIDAVNEEQEPEAEE